LRPRPRADDRLEPPREGDPFGHLRPADARVRRTPARRRAGSAHLFDLRRARPVENGVGQLPPSRAGERPSGDAPRTRGPRLRSPRTHAGHASALVQGSRTPAACARLGSPAGGGANVSGILEDLTTLSPKRLEKRLESLSREALPCRAVSVFDGNPEEGLT